MKKFFLSMLLSLGIANAGLVDAVALIVNNEAVTLYDIELRAVQMKSDKNAAVSSLIDEVLYKQEIKKNNIEVSLFDVNEYLKNIAAQNGMQLTQFKTIVSQQYPNFKVFEEETKRRIEREKLIRALVRGNIKIATKEDLKIFFNNNQDQFLTSSKFEVTQFSSQDRNELERLAKNPMLILNGVKVNKVTITKNDLNQQMKFILNSTKVGAFTPIFTANKQYVMQRVEKKEGQEIETFEEAQEKIFGLVMSQRESAFLKEYFEKLKLTAEIVVVR